MSYRVPVDEITFCAEQVLGQDRLGATEMFGDATADTRAAILDGAAKLAEDVLVPVNRDGDLHPARLENGVVRCPPGFKEAYEAIAEGGWIGISALPDYGGMGLPFSFATYTGEIMASACLSLSLNPLLTLGHIDALQHHASDEIKALYLPKLISGEWAGTMNLTEPQAGTDVGALTTRAEPAGDGTYRITGQKIFITWGDHELTRNISHLVLARLPDAAPGTKGISLFVVPKFIPDENGEPGAANSLRAVSLEEKLGIHGSPTAVMAYDGATGWLVGEPHGGMAAMFTMMNNARVGVGTEGVGLAEAATQQALAYALERKQGRTPDGSATISGHADVRRMLMTMQALTRATRALCYDCALSLDMAHADDPEGHWAARGAFLTPIAKAVGADTGIEVTTLGMQVHGGMGYIEETGAAQYARDVRITGIYEGTNGVQAMDLVGRKLADGGAAAQRLLAEITDTAQRLSEADEALAALAPGVSAAADHVRKATEWMLAAPDINDRFAGGTPYLRLWGHALGAHYMGRAALADPQGTRLALAGFYINQIAPHAAALAAAATQGAAPLYEVPAEELGL